ncbi:hypothetical protein BCR43DRAFT_490623 [Syncephalastrum racemosum]|uniref:PX domain-containing protein n=1 Tax=Syncephalastrum racemosum TaxID=13706 RepID=A0A1X2HGA8_SYNRA|nr:hypothetical protein BCR43DRAFT_490623 [Syncephalastrum racemosum]
MRPCDCPISQTLQRIGSDAFAIVSTEKKQPASDSSGFVVYLVRFEDKTAERRYSDFDSFRQALTRLYPDVLVPPIPEKHSLTDYYAQVPTKRITDAKKDEDEIVQKRKRMLHRFLVRVASHPRLYHEHVFHRFLDGNVPWNEVLNSPPLSTLPRDMLNETSAIPQFTSSSVIPVPSLSYALKAPDARFTTREAEVEKHVSVSTNLDRVQRRYLRRLTELSYDYAELGTVYTAIGLNETQHVAASIEKLGSVTDTTSVKLRQLARSIQTEFSEHMQEYAQYTNIVKQVLRYRRLKQAQLEMIHDALQEKRTALDALLKTEDKASQLKATLMQPEEAVSAADSDSLETRSIEDGFANITDIPTDVPPEEATNGHESDEYPVNASASALRASRDRSKKWSSPRKFLNAVSYTIQGMMDIDPETTRKNQIAKLKNTVFQLQDAATKTESELKEVSEGIQREINMYEKQCARELRSMMIAYAKMHIAFCEQNAMSWKEAREQVDLQVSQ